MVTSTIDRICRRPRV